MPNIKGRYIVETDWLAEHLSAPDLVLVDGSLHLPTAKRDARAEYEAAHIPGAIFFDIDDIADDTHPMPHMLPPPAKFSSRVRGLGIGDGMRVIAYDSVGLYSAARVWWMFRAMGHEDVAVLNGGLPKWRAEGRPVTDMPTPARQERHFTPRMNASLIRDIDDMRSTVQTRAEQVLDARAPGRFNGVEPEPRESLRSGHMPGAINVHYASLLSENGTLKPEAELRAVFDAAGVDVKKPVVTTCGSGVTACIVSLALATIGRADVPVYDGSWTEWGDAASGCPVTLDG